MKIILVLLCFCHLLYGAQTCPSNCQCHLTDKAVDCYNRELKFVPANIPLDTEILDLSSNDIETIHPTMFHNLTKLTDIVLNDNKISKMDPQTFQNLNKLEVIKLSQNFLSKIPEGLFDNLPNLKTLQLSNNYLTSFSAVFKTSNKLQSMDLHGNNIQVIKNPDFRMVPKLMELNLSQNKIVKIENYVFRPLSMLSTISLNANPLKNADRLLSKNRRLSYIDMSECQLTTVPRGLPDSVEHLKLIKNNITKIKPKDFRNKNYLKILALDENEIEFIAPNSFKGLQKLIQLWLNGNRLRKFPSPISPSVTNVYLAKNNITKLSASDFPGNSLMTELILNENSIQSLQPKLFRNLQHLRRLMINSNKITKLNGFTFYGLKNLQLLSLEHNLISTFEKNSFTGISSLYELNLASILLSNVTVKGNIFENFQNLKILDISMSEGLSKEILSSPEMMKSLQNLVELNLMDNNLQTMESNTMRQFPNLKKVNLVGNMWHCDQELKWLKSWMSLNEDMIEMKEDVTCSTPPELRNKRIMDLQKSQFAGLTTKKIQINEVSTMNSKPPTVSKTTEMMTTHKTTTVPSILTTKTPKSNTKDQTKTKPNIEFTTIKLTSHVSSATEDDRDKMADVNPVIADGYISFNLTGNYNQSDDSVLPDDELTEVKAGYNNYSLIIIIIATTLTLFVVLVIIIIIIIICRRREKVVYHRALQYHKENGDVVFFVGDVPQCVATLTKPSRKDSRSRSERGSTSSRPNEDITNELDTTMKIYSLDEE